MKTTKAKAFFLALAALFAVSLAVPATAQAGGYRYSHRCDCCGAPIYQSLVCVGRDRCGHPLYRWADCSHSCRPSYSYRYSPRYYSYGSDYGTSAIVSGIVSGLLNYGLHSSHHHHHHSYHRHGCR